MKGFIGISNVLVTLIPAKMAAEWFPENELSKATGVVLSAQICGNALGVLLPPLFITGPVNSFEGDRYPEDWSAQIHLVADEATDEVHFQMFWFFLFQAIGAFIVFLLVIVLYRARPEFAPSESRFLSQGPFIYL